MTFLEEWRFKCVSKMSQKEMKRFSLSFREKASNHNEITESYSKKNSIGFLDFNCFLLFLFLVPLIFSGVSFSTLHSSSLLLWNNDTSYPFPLYYPVVFTGQDHCIYVFGGQSSSFRAVSDSFKFNSTAYFPREWETIASMPTAVYGAAGCVGNDGRFFIFGGLGTNVSSPTFIQIYNVTDNGWKIIIPNMPSGSSIADVFMSCAVDSSTGLMYITGGENDGKRFYSYNVSSNNITNLATTSSSSLFRSNGQGSFVINGKLYAFGGGNDVSGYVATTYIYDITNKSWVTGANMTKAAKNFGYATDGSRFYVIGGYDGILLLNYVQIFNISSEEWIENNDTVFSGGIYGNAVAYLDGSLHSIGGDDGIGYLSMHRIASLCGIYAFSGPCDDENQCTLNDTCQSNGTCIGISNMSCPTPSNQCKRSVCNSIWGCEISTGTPCSLNNKCLLNTSCFNGECVGQSKTCANSSACDLTTGKCINKNISISSSISAGTIAGIVVALLVFIAIVVVVVIVVLVKYKRKRQSDQIQTNSVEFLSLPQPRTKTAGKYTKIDLVQFLEKIGVGNFGDVYHGKWNGTIDVALKQLKASEHFEKIFQEVSMLQSLNHPNIVRFYGIHTVPNGEHFAVMEYMREGSLDRIMQNEKKKIPLVDLLSIMKDTASGMAYLHQQGIVHRDLALRNLLVAQSNKPGTKHTIKISDFGMMKMIDKGYCKTESKTIPVQWCSLEVLQFGKFSFYSDVWAFGVVMWEIFSYGMIPYAGLSNVEVIEKVTIEGYRLPSPKNCPKEIYQWMLDCWNNEPEKRPSFGELYDLIERKWKYSIPNQLKN